MSARESTAPHPRGNVQKVHPDLGEGFDWGPPKLHTAARFGRVGLGFRPALDPASNQDFEEKVDMEASSDGKAPFVKAVFAKHQQMEFTSGQEKPNAGKSVQTLNAEPMSAPPDLESTLFPENQVTDLNNRRSSYAFEEEGERLGADRKAEGESPNKSFEFAVVQNRTAHTSQADAIDQELGEKLVLTTSEDASIPLLEERRKSLSEGMHLETGALEADRASEQSTDSEEGARPLEVEPRSYQLEVLEQAKRENTIAFLETGSGKTLIAVMLIRAKAEEYKLLGSKKLSVFLVPKVPLVYQQSDVVRVNTGLRVGHYCGEMGVDFWDHGTWVKEFDENEVLVMTAQIFLNILRHSFLKISSVGLLILDECHHAVKKHPYSLIMQEFYHPASKEHRPAIFGMTASPVNLKGVSSQEDCAYKLRSLEVKLDARVCTIQDRGVLEEYVPTPHERTVEYDPPLVKWSLRRELEGLMNEVEKIAPVGGKKRKWVAVPNEPPEKETMGEMRLAEQSEDQALAMEIEEATVSSSQSADDSGAGGSNQRAEEGGRTLHWKRREDGGKSTTLLQKLGSILYVLDELGQWFAYKVAKRYLKKVSDAEGLPGSDLPADTEAREVQLAYLKSVVKLLRCTLQEGPAEFNNFAEGGSEEQAKPGGDHADPVLGAAVKEGLVSPKVQALVRTLLQYRTDSDDFRCIMFVERIATAKVLPSLMLELPSLRFLVCCALIGHANQHMKSREQQEVIDNFRSGRVTLLIATSVAEEGLDIQACHSVIRFDLAKTVCGYIQSRGRARRKGSDYVLMVERDNSGHIEYVRGAQSSEEKMRREAIQRSEMTVDVPAFASDVASYSVPSTGALVSMNSAVQLIQYYCSKLPHDKYTILQPNYRILENVIPGGGVTYTCEVELPCNAPFRGVAGPEKSSMREAQQAACLEACKKLHESGAFNDMLLPDKGALGGPDVERNANAASEGQVKRRAYKERAAMVLGGKWIYEKRRKGEKTIMQLYAVEIVKRRKVRKPGAENEILKGENAESIDGSFEKDQYKEGGVCGAEENGGESESVTSFGFLLEQRIEDELLSIETELFVKKDVSTKAQLVYCGEVHLAQTDVKFLKDFHIRLLSTILELNLQPSEADWDPSKLYVLVPMIKKSGQLGLPRNRPWDINWEAIKNVSRDPAWATIVPPKKETNGKSARQVWVPKAEENGPRPMTSSSGGSDSTAGGSSEQFASRPASPGDWAPIGSYSFRGENEFRGRSRGTRSPSVGGWRQNASGRGGNLTRTISVPARLQSSPPPGALLNGHMPPLSPTGGFNQQVFPTPHLAPAAQYPIPLLQQHNGDPAMQQQMALQQMMAANNAALAALMTQQQALMGAVAAQQQLASATDPASKQLAVNTLLHAQSQVVASANAAANAAVSQTQNLNQLQFHSGPVQIPYNPRPASPMQGVEFGPQQYPPSTSPVPGLVVPGYQGVNPNPSHVPPNVPGYQGVIPNPSSPVQQRQGHKSASSFYQQRGSYATQNAAPPNLKRQGSGLVSASQVIEQISSGGQPTEEMQAAMGGRETYAPRTSPRSKNPGGSSEGLGRGMMRSGSSRSMTWQDRSSSDEGQREERGFKGSGKKGRGLKRSSSQSSMKRWDGALVLSDGPVNPDALQGRVVIATHSGKRFFVDKIEVDLDADSPFPRKDNAAGSAEYATFTEYYWKRYGLKLLHRKQPLIRCSGVPRVRNLLVPRYDTPSESDATPETTRADFFVQLPAELCQVHPIGSDVMRLGLHVPSVMRRIESLLLAAQLRAQIGRPIAVEKVLQALTSSSCQEAFSYERAELLGDGFLKYVVSRRLFLLHPTRHEGQLTSLRQAIVSNSSLYQLALEKGLEGLAQADLFNPVKWAAPGLPKSGLVEKEGLEKGLETSIGATVGGLEARESLNEGSAIQKGKEDPEKKGAEKRSVSAQQLGEPEKNRGIGLQDVTSFEVAQTAEKEDAGPLLDIEFPPLVAGASSRILQSRPLASRIVRPLFIEKGPENFASPKGGDKLGRLVIEKAVPSPASVLAVSIVEESPNGKETRVSTPVEASSKQLDDVLEVKLKAESSQIANSPSKPVAYQKDQSKSEQISSKPRPLEVNEAGYGATEWRVISDKALADVVEALIGTYHAEGGASAASAFMEWVGIETQYPSEAFETAARGADISDGVLQSVDCAVVEAAIGYSFKSKAPLVEALTHPTGAELQVPCYQRLEFLGDAVLDYLITRHLFDTFPDLSPGMLTDLRSAAVNNENFARVTVNRGLHQNLRHRSAALLQQVTSYAMELEAAGASVTSFGLINHQAPKVLGDVLESLAGAILLDCGLDHETVWRVFEPLLQPIVTPETLPIQPIRELQEACQRLDEGLEYRQNRVGRLAQVDVYVNGQMVGSAQNTQRKMAQKHAARTALEHLRQQYGAELQAAKPSPSNSQPSGQPMQGENRQRLNELCAKKGWPVPEYFAVSELNAATDIRFTYGVKVRMLASGEATEVTCQGEAMPSIKKAKDSAAIKLLRKLEEVPNAWKRPGKEKADNGPAS